MPRYFFHIYHDRAELDYQGEELPDKQAAWQADGSNGRICELLYVLHIIAEKPK